MKFIGAGLGLLVTGLVAAVGMVLMGSLALAGALSSVTTADPAAAASVAPASSASASASALGSAASDIPAPYLADAEASGRRFGVPWTVIAAIYRLECDFGRSRLAGCNPRGTENSRGAQGPGQFLAPTWRRGLGPMALIPLGPPTALDAAGFATDGDGDGLADPWDPADAMAATARMLAADGGSGHIAAAVFAYDHSDTYVREVVALAAHYGLPASSRPAPSSPGRVATVVAFARSQLGAPYRWGGAGPLAWDCSGLVMAAYATVGIDLPHNAEAQYEATAGTIVAIDALQPGDLVFFGPDRAAIAHVGIAIGGGLMIDAPHTGATVRVEPFHWPDLLVATRPMPAVGGGGSQS